MIAFTIDRNSRKHAVGLVYRRGEYSFDTAGPRPEGCKTCIVINYIQLEYGDERRVLCVSGYCPYQGWAETQLSPPPHFVADLVVVTPEKLFPGGGFRLNDLDDRWPVHANSEGWVCIGDPADQGDQAVEFALGCVAVLKGDRPVALWLRPAMVDD